jgi:hypothetical protein
MATACAQKSSTSSNQAAAELRARGHQMPGGGEGKKRANSENVRPRMGLNLSE